MKSNGFGVYKDELKGYWCFRVVRERNYKRSGFKTRAEAIKARLDFVKELEHQKNKAANPNLDEVFELYIKEGTLSKAEGTIKKQRSVYSNHISPKFGKCYLSDLTSGEINLFLENCYRIKGYSFGYVEGFLKCFYAIISFAYSKKFISKEAYNEFLIDKRIKIQMPAMKDEDVLKKRDGVRVFSKEEIAVMRERLGNDTLRLAFELALNCGLRISEVFALTWSDIDLENGVLKVDKQLLRIENNWCFCQPKYISSYRNVFLNDYIKSLLKNAKKSLTDNAVVDRRLTGISKPLVVKDFLLTDEKGKNYSTYAFKPWSEVFHTEMGIKDFTFHALRHTFCSEIAALNCPVSELCRMAGHNSIETTMNYYINSTKSGEKAAREALNKMGENNFQKK